MICPVVVSQPPVEINYEFDPVLLGSQLAVACTHCALASVDWAEQEWSMIHCMVCIVT
jgi:hypothetical protein